MKSFRTYIREEDQTRNIRGPAAQAWTPQQQTTPNITPQDLSDKEAGLSALAFYNDPANRKKYPPSMTFADPEVGAAHQSLKAMQQQLGGIFQKVYSKFQTIRPKDAQNVKRDITTASDGIGQAMIHLTDHPPESDIDDEEEPQQVSNAQVTGPYRKAAQL